MTTSTTHRVRPRLMRKVSGYWSRLYWRAYQIRGLRCGRVKSLWLAIVCERQVKV